MDSPTHSGHPLKSALVMDCGSTKGGGLVSLFMPYQWKFSIKGIFVIIFPRAYVGQFAEHMFPGVLAGFGPQNLVCFLHNQCVFTLKI